MATSPKILGLPVQESDALAPDTVGTVSSSGIDFGTLDSYALVTVLHVPSGKSVTITLAEARRLGLPLPKRPL